MTTPKFDYYWRDFLGEIPDDAIPGGFTRNLEPTYIVQVYVPTHGLLTTQLYPGATSVTASRHGVHTSDDFIKIFCSKQPNKLQWFPVTATNLHVESIGKHLVIGGAENGKILNIGRVAYQEEVIVGKVCSYNMGQALLYFPYDGAELTADSYEVLVFENDPDIDVR